MRQHLRQWSISRRLTSLYVATTVVLLVLAAAYLYWTQVNNLAREDNDFLVSKIQDCRRLLREHPNEKQPLINEIQTEAVSSPTKYYIRLLDDQGKVLMETPDMAGRLPAGTFPEAVGTEDIPHQGILREDNSEQTCLLMAGKAAVDRAGKRVEVLQAALDVSEEEDLITDYRWTLLTVVLLGTVFSGIAGIFVVRKGLAPLQEIAQATERVTASQLHERIAGEGWPKELVSLAKGFDRMLDRLEDSFKRLSQFSADLAHELRTPVNNLRGEAGVALSQARSPDEYRRTLESSLEEFERLARLIDGLLFLARADSPTTGIVRERGDARQAVESVREFYEAMAEDRGVELRCQGQGTVNADPVLFRQAVSNLLSNALNHTPRGGRVEVLVNERGGGGLEVRVSDTGSGIAAEHLPHIFDRLYRADPARSQHPDGAGLGLAIVKSIMGLHGGSVEVESKAGQGSSFTLFFPASPPTTAANLTKL